MVAKLPIYALAGASMRVVKGVGVLVLSLLFSMA